jgi:hypothetical protein
MSLGSTGTTTSGVIVLAPPWPRSGSANIFAAQTLAHAERGARVLLLLTPLGRGFAHGKTRLWRDAVAAMCFPGVETVIYPRTGRRRLRAYLQWLRAGRDDAIAISARYAAAGALPCELWSFVRSARIDLIHANHVFSVLLAQRLACLIERVQGARPRILLDTHDIQSDAMAVARRKNPLSRRPDAPAALRDTELGLSAAADTLAHVTPADLDFFAARLPRRRHALIRPTLHPDTEAVLTRLRGIPGPAHPCLVYVGNQHEANLATLRWLLGEVLPLAAPGVRDRVRIFGAVGGLLSRRDPCLFECHRRLFAGEVPSVLAAYAAAGAVLAPAAAGTGASVKLIEALCAGKPVLTTSLGLRGLTEAETAGAAIHVHDGAAEFAAAMGACVGGRRTSGRPAGQAPGAAAVQANARLYDRLFSNARYRAALDDAVEMTGSARLERKESLEGVRASCRPGSITT